MKLTPGYQRRVERDFAYSEGLGRRLRVAIRFGLENVTAWLSAPRVISMVLFAIGIVGIAIGYAVETDIAGALLQSFEDSLLVSVGPELVGIAAGVLIIDWANDSVQSRHELNSATHLLKATTSGTAEDALTTIVGRNWLFDGSLVGADMAESNLRNAKLTLHFIYERAADTFVRMQISPRLARATLRFSILSGSELEGADLRNSDLLGCQLLESNLQGANLDHADARYCDFSSADLRGTSLRGTNMQHARLEGAIVTSPPPVLDSTTILPDGAHWRDASDLERFVDTGHSDYESQEGFEVRTIRSEKRRAH